MKELEVLLKSKEKQERAEKERNVTFVCILLFLGFKITVFTKCKGHAKIFHPYPKLSTKLFFRYCRLQEAFRMGSGKKPPRKSVKQVIR